MTLLERLEDRGDPLGIDADAVVVKLNDQTALRVVGILGALVHAPDREVSPLGKLRAVLCEVPEDLHQPRLVGP